MIIIDLTNQMQGALGNGDLLALKTKAISTNNIWLKSVETGNENLAAHEWLERVQEWLTVSAAQTSTFIYG